jgi:hypothetical protein
MSEPTAESNLPQKRGTRAAGWVLLFVVVAATLAVVITPALIIQPFKSQTARGVELSYTLRRWAPLVTMIGTVLTLGLGLYLVRGRRRLWLKLPALLLCFGLTLIAAWFARQNHFEWMFNPLPNASFVRTGEADFVSGADKVLAVEINGDAVAFPIRQMGYHHVVQDVVGGVPLVATY